MNSGSSYGNGAFKSCMLGSTVVVGVRVEMVTTEPREINIELPERHFELW